MIINGDAAQVAAAFVAARAEMQTSIKNDAKGVYNNYPTLRKVVDTITPFLKDNGLTFSQEPASSDSGVGVSTTIMHASGATIEFGTLIMPIADKKPQTVGSAITYAKRYALTSIFGLVGTDDDDDGQAAQDSYKAKAKPAVTQAPDDALWDTPATHSKQPDTVSPDNLARITSLGVSVYGKDFVNQSSKLAEWASQGARKTLGELKVMEGDKLIRSLEKKLNPVIPDPDRSQEQGQENGVAA